MNPWQQQKGVTLLVSILVLTIATLISIYTMKSTTFQLKLSANERLAVKNFWCSKSTLDYFYEYNFTKTQSLESIFSIALNNNGLNVALTDTQMPEKLIWDSGGNLSQLGPPEITFHIAHTRQALGKPAGWGNDTDVMGFEMNARCSVASGRSSQVYGVSALVKMGEGNLIR